MGVLAGTNLRQISRLDQHLKDNTMHHLGGSAFDILTTTLDEKSSNERISNPRPYRLLGQIKNDMLTRYRCSAGFGFNDPPHFNERSK
jgi:hypothetical protein